ncbi:MAG: ABC transporter substrate binding protein [Pseudomonadota bacterium]
MVLWNEPTPVDEGFRRAFEERDLPITVDMVSIGKNPSRLPDVVNLIEREAPDLVYTNDVQTTLGVAGRRGDIVRRLSGTPITFAMACDPVETGVVSAFGPSGRNTTGVSQVAPVAAQIQAMRSYLPVSRIATIQTLADPVSANAVERLSIAAEAVDIRVDAFEVPAAINGAPQAEALPSLVEEISDLAPQFLYLGPDRFTAEHAETITTAAIHHGLPTFATMESSLRRADALFGLIAHDAAVGRLVAEKALAILFGGVDPGDLPVEHASPFSHALRSDVARRLGVFPSLALLDYAEIIEREA